MIRNFKICSLYLIFFVCLVSNAFGLGSIKGRIVDGFGVPIEGASVKIKGTDFNTATDGRGEYNVAYKSGIAKLTFSKRGYTRLNIVINVTEEADTDCKTINLWKYPKKGGLFLVRKSDYVEIKKTSFTVEQTPTTLNFIIQGDPVVIPWQNITILDYDKDNSLVSGKNLFKVYENNSIGILGPSKTPIRSIRDKYIKIVNNAGLRVANLEPGKYFYYLGSLNDRTRMGSGHFIEVKP